jgi:hypothetical protein
MDKDTGKNLIACFVPFYRDYLYLKCITNGADVNDLDDCFEQYKKFLIKCEGKQNKDKY